MDLTQQLEAAKQEMIQLLLKEYDDLNKRMDEVDAIRTRLLNSILEFRMQQEGVEKQLRGLGHDTSNLP